MIKLKSYYSINSCLKNLLKENLKYQSCFISGQRSFITFYDLNQSKLKGIDDNFKKMIDNKIFNLLGISERKYFLIIQVNNYSLYSLGKKEHDLLFSFYKNNNDIEDFKLSDLAIKLNYIERHKMIIKPFIEKNDQLSQID